MENRMTLHRALSELKIIDSRIEKGIEKIDPTGYMQKGKLVNSFLQKDEFDENAKSKLQSITDLIERKNKIKSAIVHANGKTMVKIGDKEMTIADAINFKGIVEFKRALINKLEGHLRINQGVINRENEKTNARALQLAVAALSKDNVKIGDADAIAITEPFIKVNEYHLVDPLGVEKLCEEMTDELDDFETEVDATLSEINAITIVEI